MKRLLILLMVLATVSNVSAQLVVEFVIVGSTNPAGDYQGIPSFPTSTILTIGLVETTQGGIQSTSVFDILGPGNAQAPLWHPAGASQGGGAPWWTGLCNDGTIVNDGTTLIEGIELACQQNFLDYVTPGTILYTFDYHVSGVLSDIIEIKSVIAFPPWDWDPAAPSILIHVPEPVTIALLGLGGLLLRRPSASSQ